MSLIIAYLFVNEWKGVNYLDYVNSMYIIYCKIVVMVEQYFNTQ